MPELGEKIGVGRTNIYKWKTQTPAVETISKVAIFFGVSVDKLIGYNVDTAWAIAAGTIDIEFLLNNYSTLKYGEKILTADDVKRMKIILDAVFLDEIM